jgi:hypothetical protein
MKVGCLIPAEHESVGIEISDAKKRLPLESLFRLEVAGKPWDKIKEGDRVSYGSPIFKAVQKKRCEALYRALKKSLKPPESAVGAGAERSHVERSVGASQ